MVGDAALLEADDRQALARFPPIRTATCCCESSSRPWRLERTPDALVFTIRIHRWPLGEVLGEIDRAGDGTAGVARRRATYKNPTSVTGWPPISVGR